MPQFISDYVLWIAPIFSFIVAQMLKYVIYAIQYKVLRKERLTGAGGMPSSHSSGVCTIITVMALTQGASSPYFALALVFGLIVMYDAAGVRRASGLHAKVINVLRESLDEYEQERMGEEADSDENRDDDYRSTEKTPTKPLKEFVGHTPLEVICGAVLGVVIGFMFV